MSQLYDVAIIGGGPAGLSAAIYLARAQYRVLVLEKEKIGGQITITAEVVNYPGVLKTSGEELTEQMKQQALNFGASFLLTEVIDVDFTAPIKKIKTEKGEIEALGVVIATGASPRMVGFEGEEQYRGRGVAYCATCDGEFFTGAELFVVGGGFAAAEEAMFLTKYAKKVTILVRGKNFSCAQSVIDQVEANEKIEVRYNTELLSVSGDGVLNRATLRNRGTGEEYHYENNTPEGFGVFVFAGYQPATALFAGKVALNEGGYLLTDGELKTNVDGVYGAGDVCVKELRQVVTAVSDGARAATILEKYVSSLYEQLSLTEDDFVPRKRAVKPAAPKQEQSAPAADDAAFITQEMRMQLAPVFERFERNITLKIYLDEREVSHEVQAFVQEVAALSDKIKLDFAAEDADMDVARPAIVLCDEQGQPRGVAFHGVPGGHEFNSFVVSLYNAAGPGQPLDEAVQADIAALHTPHRLQVVISLSCTMCPELVMAASRVALESEHITMDMYDIAHYPDLKEQYQIKSVPCLIIDGEQVHFGKKNISQLLALLAN